MKNVNYDSEYKMNNFFTDTMPSEDGVFALTGENHHHLSRVLRMKAGERIYISFGGRTDLCEITEIGENSSEAKIITQGAIDAELPVELILFQALPKGDKMETIIQKCVELGAKRIVPVEMKRCVMKLDEKRKKSKLARWQSVSESAAKQSKRSVIPEIAPVLSFNDAMKAAEGLDLFLVPYENERGMADTVDALESMRSKMKVGILIGPEGGFEPSELEAAKEAGGRVISLGSRILRTETAAITAVGMCMLFIEAKMKEGADERS